MEEKEIVTTAVSKAKEVLEALDFSADISAHMAEGDEDRMYIHLEIEGEELGSLIGFQGRRLRALERVIGLMVSKVTKENEVEGDYRVVVDINEYKTKREDNIKEIVLKAIGQMREANQRVELPVMNPAERRIVHLVCKDEGVNTESEGEEGQRRVILLPE